MIKESKLAESKAPLNGAKPNTYTVCITHHSLSVHYYHVLSLFFFAFAQAESLQQMEALVYSLQRINNNTKVSRFHSFLVS